MSDTVFVLSAGNVLTPMTRVGFQSEDIFQALLAAHPEIIGGTSAGVPLLVSREQGIAESAESANRWSVDHLYLDSRGVPILVEVKRATDTRARREVVAQMLDYASHAVNSWRVDQIQAAFTDTCTQRGDVPEEVLTAFLPHDLQVEAFWRAVEANLRAGRVRMLFVADQISKELRRIVEFLNEQMRPAEVMAIEVEHYLASDGTRTLVPKTLGATERAASAKAVTERPNIANTAEWIDRLAESQERSTVDGARWAVALFERLGGEVAPTESRHALYARWVSAKGKQAWPFFLRHSTGGRLELALAYLRSRPAFASEEARREALDRFRMTGLDVRATEKLNGYPSIDLKALAIPETHSPFEAFAHWVVDKAKLD